jgi:hypothetical protein
MVQPVSERAGDPRILRESSSMRVESSARQVRALHTRRPGRRQTGKAGPARRGSGSAPGGAPRRASRRRKARPGRSVDSWRVASAIGVCTAPWPASLRDVPVSFRTNLNASPLAPPVLLRRISKSEKSPSRARSQCQLSVSVERKKERRGFHHP